MTNTENQAAGWRTIESAPRDGSKVLIYSEQEGVQVAFWHQDTWDMPSDYACHFATHWMPLPEPPTS